MASILPYILLAVVAGFCLPTQAGINSQLNLWTRSPVLAAAISFAVGTCVLVLYALFARIPLPAGEAVSRHPWWIWFGGFVGAFYVGSTIVLAPRLGAASMVSTIVAGQMIASLVLDHYGLVGYSVHPVSWPRVLGVLLLVGGVVMIRVF